MRHVLLFAHSKLHRTLICYAHSSQLVESLRYHNIKACCIGPRCFFKNFQKTKQVPILFNWLPPIFWRYLTKILETKSIPGKNYKNFGMIHFVETNQVSFPNSILQHIGIVATLKLVSRRCLRYLQTTLIWWEGDWSQKLYEVL